MIKGAHEDWLKLAARRQGPEMVTVEALVIQGTAIGNHSSFIQVEPAKFEAGIKIWQSHLAKLAKYGRAMSKMFEGGPLWDGLTWSVAKASGKTLPLGGYFPEEAVRAAVKQWQMALGKLMQATTPEQVMADKREMATALNLHDVFPGLHMDFAAINRALAFQDGRVAIVAIQKGESLHLASVEDWLKLAQGGKQAGGYLVPDEKPSLKIPAIRLGRKLLDEFAQMFWAEEASPADVLIQVSERAKRLGQVMERMNPEDQQEIMVSLKQYAQQMHQIRIP